MSKKTWSEEEEKILFENAQKPVSEIMKLLPKRSKHAIYHKRNSLGIRVTKKITESGLQFIKDNHKVMTAKELADHIGATPDAVKYRLRSLGLPILNGGVNRFEEEWEIDNVETGFVAGEYSISIDYFMK